MSTIDAAIAEMGAKAQPALRLAPAAGSSSTTIGGVPRLPKDFTWPSYQAKPLAFLAQIDAAAVSRVLGSHRPAWFPERGSLLFFYDAEQSTWGYDPKDRGSWQVTWVADAESLTLATLPDEIPEHARYRARSLEPLLTSSCPGVERLSTDVSALSSDDDERLRNFGRPHEQASQMHQVLGFPRPIQNDNMELECQVASNGVYVGSVKGWEDPRVPQLKPGAADWRLLLQVDTDDDAGMMWGDCGMLYFWVREQDAMVGDFSRVWMVLQCC